MKKGSKDPFYDGGKNSGVLPIGGSECFTVSLFMAEDGFSTAFIFFEFFFLPINFFSPFVFIFAVFLSIIHGIKTKREEKLSEKDTNCKRI